jgi:uncharacterized protein
MRAACVAALLLLPALLCAATPEFPALDGRVVDKAGMLSAGVEQALTRQLATHEQATTHQIMVVTLPDLQGYTIEDFGYRLGRHWGIGQQEKDNGVLLLVAAAERKVRIEVGYGLEGVLTDALSSNIIHAVILPRFRGGDFEGGITQGAAAIIRASGGEYELRQPPRENTGMPPPFNYLFTVLVILIFLSSMTGIGGRGIRRGGLGGFGGGRPGRGGGGFRGGGGSFGGGGASGGW